MGTWRYNAAMMISETSDDIRLRREQLGAALLDLDGVLVDSEPVHGMSWETILGPLGIEVPGGWESWIGVPDQELAKRLHEERGLFKSAEALLASKRQAYRDIAPERLEAFDGVAEGIEEMRRRDWPVLVVTSSTRETAEATLSAAGLSELLEEVVAFEDTAGHKPDPEPYLAGARRAGVEARRCLVIEDSAAGITAARQAGCLALGVSATARAGSLEGAHEVFSTTREALGWALGRS